MNLASLRVLGICLVLGLAAGVIGGVSYALIADKLIMYGIAVGWLVTGLIVLALGLLGATEPPEGWHLRRPDPAAEDFTPRRSLVARAAYEHPKIENRVSSASLAVWGIVVGGGLIGLSMFAFGWAGV